MAIPPLRELLSRLVATPSVSSVSPTLDMGNGEITQLLAQWCEDLGLDVELQHVGDHPPKANLVARLGAGDDGLVLAGHTDTVPYDGGRWHSDPFRLEERDGRLYGLGTADMKAFIALALEAVRDLDRARLRRPLSLLFTADEESSMVGAKTLASTARRLGREVVIGEPTGLRPVRLHKGIMMESIHILGRSGHSSDPSLGNSALEGMHQVIDELLTWRGELQSAHRNPGFEIPYPTLNLGHIQGGDNPNRICGECELHLDLRPLPGMAIETLREVLRRHVEERLAGSGLTVTVQPLFEGVPAMETPAGAEVVRAAEALTGQDASGVAFATEGPYLQRLGLDVLVLGPGDIAQAHQPDEFVAADRLPPALNCLRGLIGQRCLAGG